MLTTLTAILLALAVSFGGAGATVYAAQAALPGDVLYPVKIGLEDAQVALSANEATGAQLRLDLAQRRMEETIALIAQGRYGDVHAAASRLESDAHQATEAFGAVAQVDPDYARTLVESLDTALARHAQVFSNLLVTLPDEARPAVSRALQLCEASRERLRNRSRPQWRTEQPDDDVPPGPPDGVPRGQPSDVPLGPPDHAPRGQPNGVPPSPPDGVPRGQPSDVPLGPPDHAPQRPPDEAPQSPSHHGPQGLSDDSSYEQPDGMPRGPRDEAPQGPGDDALENPPSGTHRGSSGRNR